jgi:hypothetical protein
MEIKLYNRDGADLRLVSDDELLWRFKVDKEHLYVLEYIRVGYMEDNKTIDMIDPSGGPYLSIGTKLNEKYIIDAFVDIDNELMIHTNSI